MSHNSVSAESNMLVSGDESESKCCLTEFKLFLFTHSNKWNKKAYFCNEVFLHWHISIKGILLNTVNTSFKSSLNKLVIDCNWFSVSLFLVCFNWSIMGNVVQTKHCVVCVCPRRLFNVYRQWGSELWSQGFCSSDLEDVPLKNLHLRFCWTEPTNP